MSNNTNQDTKDLKIIGLYGDPVIDILHNEVRQMIQKKEVTSHSEGVIMLLKEQGYSDVRFVDQCSFWGIR